MLLLAQTLSWLAQIGVAHGRHFRFEWCPSQNFPSGFRGVTQGMLHLKYAANVDHNPPPLSQLLAESPLTPPTSSRLPPDPGACGLDLAAFRPPGRCPAHQQRGFSLPDCQREKSLEDKKYAALPGSLRACHVFRVFLLCIARL